MVLLHGNESERYRLSGRLLCCASGTLRCPMCASDYKGSGKSVRARRERRRIRRLIQTTRYLIIDRELVNRLADCLRTYGM